jgi:hypothetical protein
MRPRRRLSALAISALLAFSALPLFAAPVAATPVGDEAAFRAAWMTDADTLITLTTTITFTCMPTPLQRDSIFPIVVDGAGFTLANTGVLCTGPALDSEGPGAVTLRNLTLTGTIASGDGLVTSGEVVVENSSITGHGGDAVDANGDGDDDGDVTVSGSTLSGNGDNGISAVGDISALGNITVTGSTLSGNGANGITTFGNVTVSGSTTISGNGTVSAGSGILVGGTVTVNAGSTISGNAYIGVGSEGGNVTVTGSTVSGNGYLGIVSGFGVTVSNSIVRDNEGAGIYSLHDATVTDSTVSDNGVDCGGPILGDGISAEDDASVTRSTISGNGDEGCGSGITGDAVTVIDSTITANASSGIEAVTATVTNSTITDNPSTGIVASNSITATHATISGNGVNLENQVFDTIFLFGTVVVDAEDVNCLDVLLVDQGFNFIDDATCGAIAANSAAHLLGALANNGGPTFTRLPADNSPLVDGIPSASCRVTVTTDQRGVARPQGGGCDIGAVEVVPPGASINDVSVTEGNAGTTVNATFTVTLSRASARQVTTSFATANGTAIAPADYQANSGTVTFVPGDVSETITIAVVGDAIDEPNETFVVNLTAPVGASFADAQGTGTILDDDVPAAATLPDAATGESDGSAASSGWLLALGLLLGIAALSLRRSRARAPIRGR